MRKPRSLGVGRVELEDGWRSLTLTRFPLCGDHGLISGCRGPAHRPYQKWPIGSLADLVACIRARAVVNWHKDCFRCDHWRAAERVISQYGTRTSERFSLQVSDQQAAEYLAQGKRTPSSLLPIKVCITALREQNPVSA